MKSEKKKILSGKECEVMNYLPYFKEPPIDVIKRYKTIKRYALNIKNQINSITLWKIERKKARRNSFDERFFIYSKIFCDFFVKILLKRLTAGDFRIKYLSVEQTRTGIFGKSFRKRLFRRSLF